MLYIPRAKRTNLYNQLCRNTFEIYQAKKTNSCSRVKAFYCNSRYSLGSNVKSPDKLTQSTLAIQTPQALHSLISKQILSFIQCFCFRYFFDMLFTFAKHVILFRWKFPQISPMYFISVINGMLSYSNTTHIYDWYEKGKMEQSNWYEVEINGFFSVDAIESIFWS